MSETILTVRVPDDLVKLARSVARSRDESLSQVLRRCLRQYVDASPAQRDLVDAVNDARESTSRSRKPRV